MNEQTRQTLSDTLLRVRNRINQIKDRKETIGEQNTKSTLIDPILSALEWNLEELDEVRREYRRKPQDNPVDYALFMLRSPCLFVEAKALEKDLNDRKWISQVLGYATVVGVEWCVLTNGDEYRIYNSHATVDIEQKLFRTIHLSNSAQEEYTLGTLGLLSKSKMGEKLITILWKAHFVDYWVKMALDNIVRNEDGVLTRLVRKNSPGLSRSEIRDSLKRVDIRVDFPVIIPSQEFKKPLAPLKEERKRMMKEGFTRSKKADLLFCKIKNVKAMGRPSENGFLVLKGSEAVLEERPSVKKFPHPSKLRTKLSEDGILKAENDRMVFTRDYEFSSSSAAASVIHGGGANGPQEWKDSNGISLKEKEEKEVSTSEIEGTTKTRRFVRMAPIKEGSVHKRDGGDGK
jgi:hypothetical protein